jgi:hypothetical protein
MVMMMVPELGPVPREQLLSIPDPVRRAILQPLDRKRLDEAVLAEVSAEQEDRSVRAAKEKSSKEVPDQIMYRTMYTKRHFVGHAL